MPQELWICPTCERKFAKKNQRHTCTRMKPEDHLRDKPEKVKTLYSTLTKNITKEVPARFDAISFAINMISRTQFGMIFVLEDKLKVEFKLPKRVSNAKIVKTAKIGEQYVHVVFIQNEVDIDTQLLNWIKQSYIFKQ